MPHLLQRPEAHIANISSMGGFLPVPGQTIYGASKAAVKLLTEGLYSELLNSHVHVSVIFPGAIGTNIAVNSGVSIGSSSGSEQKKMKTLPADQAAEAMIDGMEQNKYRILVGPDAKLMDFLSRLVPKQAAEFIYKQMSSLLPAWPQGKYFLPLLINYKPLVRFLGKGFVFSDWKYNSLVVFIGTSLMIFCDFFDSCV